jgi:hypothetical protein
MKQNILIGAAVLVAVILGAMVILTFVVPGPSERPVGGAVQSTRPAERLAHDGQPPVKQPERAQPAAAAGSMPVAVTTNEAATTATTMTKTLDDSVSTLANPVTVMTSDGQHSFLVGQPKGQNSKHPRKIIFSLPGHGSTAKQDYAAWQSHIINGEYALASVGWWDGEGEKTTDYLRPDEVLAAIRAFLDTYGYATDDFVVLEGFSRGSANTYAVKAYDVVSGHPVIDAVISASGKYQKDFPLTPDQSAYSGGQLYQGVPWILACGAKDDNPTRDGCEGMTETKTYLTGMGANVLKLLEDPNGGHGAFHQSPLKLPELAFKLLDALPVTTHH